MMCLMWSLALSAITRGAPIETRTAIQSQYARYAKAYIANDVGEILAVLSPTYTLTGADKVEIPLSTYAFTLQKRKDEGARVGGYTVEMLGIVGNTVQATVISKETTIAADDPTYKHIHFYRDTWVNIVGEWRLDSTTTIRHG